MIELLRGGEAFSSAQVAKSVGVAVQTARRYLEYLVIQRLAARSSVYGSVGRPEQLYRWIGGAATGSEY